MNGEVAYFVLAEKEKCTGCRACEVACFAAHQKGTLKTVGAVTAPVIPNLYLTRLEQTCMPVQCHHCEGAPCLQSCLTGAIERIDGTVVLNEKKCIGCKNCVMACPFGAAVIIGAAALPCGTVAHAHKCDLCIGRDEPACVATCPNKALHLVDTAAEVQAKRIKSADAMDVVLSSSLAQGGR
jgi:electron transport protein HydN